MIIFTYELARAQKGALLAEGETTHIVTNRQMKTAALPEKYLNVFRAAVDKATSIEDALERSAHQWQRHYSGRRARSRFGRRAVLLSADARQAVNLARAVVDDIVASNKMAYAITTGVGKLSDVRIAGEQIRELQVNLVRSHAMGVGDPLPIAETRAMMLLRANSLAKGHSGVRGLVIDTICEMLNEE